MSCRIKKLLFFMVLSIVCNSTFSARTAAEIAECKANVHIAFPNDLHPYSAFKYAMYILSEKIINDLRNTTQLSNLLRHQYDLFKDEQPEFANFKSYGDKIRNQNVELTDPAKKDIYGYLKHLIINFGRIHDEIIRVAKSPTKYCEDEYTKDDWVCRNALSIMFKKNENELHRIDADKAFKYYYQNYCYLDLFNPSIFSESSSSSRIETNQQEKFQKYQLQMMVTYTRHLMGFINVVIMHHMLLDPEFFPTVEEFCNRPRSN